MTRARDVANVLSTATALATDTETAAAISSHNTAANGHIGRGTTANRPASPATGDLYYDTTLSSLIVYTSSGWNRATEPFKLTLLSGYYHSVFDIAATVNTSITINTTHFTPFYVPKTTTFDRIVARTSVVFSSGTTVVRLGIYNNSSDDRPSTVEIDAGTSSASTGNIDLEITINKQLNAGWYWLAMNCTSVAATNSFVGIAAGTATGSFLGGQATPSGNNTKGFTESVNVSNGFATTQTLTPASNLGKVWLRAA